MAHSSQSQLAFSPEVGEAYEALHSFMYSTVYVDKTAKKEEEKVERVIGGLYERLSTHIDLLPEGFLQIAQSFRMIGKIEKTHQERFEQLAKCMEEGRLFVSDTEEGWVCLNCGHIHYGKEAPAKCPVCSHEQGYFIRMSLAPWTKAE